MGKVAWCIRHDARLVGGALWFAGSSSEVLAGALSNVELGDEIPTELYKAVAEVLIFVLRLSRPAR